MIFCFSIQISGQDVSDKLKVNPDVSIFTSASPCSVADTVLSAAAPTCSPLPLAPLPSAGSKSPLVVVLCHGFSEAMGPNYALIQCIFVFLRQRGITVLLPDFRPSYKFGAARGRSERARIIAETIIEHIGSTVDSSQRSQLVLIGHSQGGAACAQACANPRVIRAAQICGLVMLGSESPIERVTQEHRNPLLEDEVSSERVPSCGTKEPELVFHERPQLPSHQVLIVHAKSDRVISWKQMEQLAARWSVPFVLLDGKSTADTFLGQTVQWADDVQHDFISLDLLGPLLVELNRFLLQF
jgi:predicted esterase